MGHVSRSRRLKNRWLFLPSTSASTLKKWVQPWSPPNNEPPHTQTAHCFHFYLEFSQPSNSKICGFLPSASNPQKWAPLLLQHIGLISLSSMTPEIWVLFHWAVRLSNIWVSLPQASKPQKIAPSPNTQTLAMVSLFVTSQPPKTGFHFTQLRKDPKIMEVPSPQP